MSRLHLQSRSLLLFLSAILLIATAVSAEVPADAKPDTGHVDGTRYTNSFFGFSYKMPENWAVQTVGGRMPGVPNGSLLLWLKRTSRTDALSRIMISATPVPAEFAKDFPGYLQTRFRLNQSVTSDVTINGFPTSRARRSSEPEMIVIGDRTFYRVQTSASGTARIALATVEKDYALIFEMLVPERDADFATQNFVDSLYGLNFTKK